MLTEDNTGESGSTDPAVLIHQVNGGIIPPLILTLNSINFILLFCFFGIDNKKVSEKQSEQASHITV